MKTKLSEHRKLLKYAHHRNGICGRPFDVAIISEPHPELIKGERQKKLVIYFPGDDCACAVFDLAQLSELDIAFGSNSWRGDHYADDMAALNKEANEV